MDECERRHTGERGCLLGNRRLPYALSHVCMHVVFSHFITSVRGLIAALNSWSTICPRIFFNKSHFCEFTKTDREN